MKPSVKIKEYEHMTEINIVLPCGKKMSVRVPNSKDYLVVESITPIRIEPQTARAIQISSE